MHPQVKKLLLFIFLFGALLIGASLIHGRIPVFLYLNHNLGPTADQFFRYITYLGDGMIWIPFTLLVIFVKRRWTLLVLACIITSTLVAQVSKNVFFKGVERPSLAIKDQPFHSVAGVELHTRNSFPSGHTTTIFTIFLLLVIIFPDKKWIIPIGFIAALMAAYSRVYLAQHFPIDVGGGMISAVLAHLLAWPIHRKWGEKLMAR